MSTNLMAAERIKLLSTRSFWWCNGLAVAGVLGLTALVAAVSDSAQPLFGIEFQVLGLLLLIVAAVTAVSAEYRYGTIRTTFLVAANRSSALLAKTAVVTAAAAVLGAVVGFGGWATAWLVQPGAELGLSTEAQWRAVAGAAAVFALIAVLTVGVAILLRNGAATQSLVLIWAVVGEAAVGYIPRVGDDLQRWLPFTNALNFQLGALSDPSAVLGPWASLAYVAAFAGAVLTVALVVAHRRDA